MKYFVQACLSLLLLWVVCGFDVPNYQWYVTDTVGVFSATQKAQLDTKIQQIQQATSIEIAVLIVSRVEDDINLAAVDVGNKRWVGKKGQNNGLVVLIAVDDKKWSMQVGYGLEWTLPDIIVNKIGEARFPTYFRTGNYYQGIVEMLDDVVWYIQQDPTITHTYTQQYTTTLWDNEQFLGYVLLAALFLLWGFGRLVTQPSHDGKKRTMKKYGWWLYALAGLWWTLLLTWFLANVVFAGVISYGVLLISIWVALVRKWWPGSGGIWFGWMWWSGGSRWWWGFGGFGGGSFGGGGSSGSR